MVPTFSIRFRQVTGELITSLGSQQEGGREKAVSRNASGLSEAFTQSDEDSPGRQPMGGGGGLPVQEGDALQLDVDVIETLGGGREMTVTPAALNQQPLNGATGGRG